MGKLILYYRYLYCFSVYQILPIEIFRQKRSKENFLRITSNRSIVPQFVRRLLPAEAVPRSSATHCFHQKQCSAVPQRSASGRSDAPHLCFAIFSDRSRASHLCSMIFSDRNFRMQFLIAKISDRSSRNAELIAKISDRNSRHAEVIAKISDRNSSNANLIAKISDRSHQNTELIAKISDRSNRIKRYKLTGS